MTLSLISKSWKIVYAQIEEDSRARGFSTVFAWLKEAATVNLCTLVTDPHLELVEGQL